MKTICASYNNLVSERKYVLINEWKSFYSTAFRRSSISGKLLFFCKVYTIKVMWRSDHEIDQVVLSEEEYIMYRLSAC